MDKVRETINIALAYCCHEIHSLGQWSCYCSVIEKYFWRASMLRCQNIVTGTLDPAVVRESPAVSNISEAV